MKQHITEKQLDELSERAMVKYSDCFLKKNYDSINGIALLSIGQMIEFLDEKASLFSIHQPSTQSRYGAEWMIEITPTQVITGKLCDCLWQAVKEVLEK